MEYQTYEDHHGNQVQVHKVDGEVDLLEYKAAPGWIPLWWSDSQCDEPVDELPRCFIPTDDDNHYYFDDPDYIKIDGIQEELSHRISRVYFDDKECDYISFLRHRDAIYIEENLYEEIDRTLHWWMNCDPDEFESDETALPLAYDNSKSTSCQESECVWLYYNTFTKETSIGDGNAKFLIDSNTSAIYAELMSWIYVHNKDLC